MSATASNLKTIKRLYECREPSKVIGFLELQPYLTPVLEEAFQQIKRHFGPKPRAVLEVIYDPEGPSAEQLLVSICSALDLEEAMKKLDDLDEEWWLDALPRGQGKLCIDVASA